MDVAGGLGRTRVADTCARRALCREFRRNAERAGRGDGRSDLVGSGALLSSAQRCRELAHTMVELGAAHGVPTRALLTDMNCPLGAAVTDRRRAPRVGRHAALEQSRFRGWDGRRIARHAVLQ